MKDPGEAFDLQGKVAVVTGAASGIGEASARMLAGAGATLVCADVDARGAKAFAIWPVARRGDDCEVTCVSQRPRDVERRARRAALSEVMREDQDVERSARLASC